MCGSRGIGLHNYMYDYLRVYSQRTSLANNGIILSLHPPVLEENKKKSLPFATMYLPIFPYIHPPTHSSPIIKKKKYTSKRKL